MKEERARRREESRSSPSAVICRAYSSHSDRRFRLVRCTDILFLKICISDVVPFNKGKAVSENHRRLGGRKDTEGEKVSQQGYTCRLPVVCLI
mmetsp:Transcript_3789/g.6844  ORF Transcript_3789/g.6844 Transcript_3789/m.6844 type:complete len:93 (+) Transcript_3789:666-944(+)